MYRKEQNVIKAKLVNKDAQFNGLWHIQILKGEEHFAQSDFDENGNIELFHLGMILSKMKTEEIQKQVNYCWFIIMSTYIPVSKN